MTNLLLRIFVCADATVEGTPIDVTVWDSDTLQIAGGVKGFHAPRHCAGQCAYLWGQHAGVLFTGGVCGDRMGPGWLLGYEDLEEEWRSLGRRADVKFGIACSGH